MTRRMIAALSVGGMLALAGIAAPAQAASPINECGHITINRYVGIVNITTRNVGCGTARVLARSAYGLSIWQNWHSFFMEASVPPCFVWITSIPSHNEFDERMTAHGGRVVHFQVYYD